MDVKLIDMKPIKQEANISGLSEENLQQNLFNRIKVESLEFDINDVINIKEEPLLPFNEGSHIKIESSEMCINDIKEEPVQLFPEISHPEPASSKELKRNREANCTCVLCRLHNYPFNRRSLDEKFEIMKEGKPTPPLNRRKDIWYTRLAWLCGCHKRALLFCWPCLLFSKEVNVWTSTGIPNMTFKRRRHEDSDGHIKSVIELNYLNDLMTNDQMINSNSSILNECTESLKNNKDILRLMIDVACVLGKQGLPFRNPSGWAHTMIGDNFVQFLNLTGERGNPLNHSLKNSTEFSNPSHQIQDDVMKAILELMISNIKNEIENTEFVALIVEESRNHATNELRFSQILRYVSSSGEVEERFIGFVTPERENEIPNLIERINITLDDFKCKNKLISQTYNTIVFPFNKKKSEIKQLISRAPFVHYYAHSFNEVLTLYLSDMVPCRNFFSTVCVLAKIIPQIPEVLSELCLKTQDLSVGSKFLTELLRKQHTLLHHFQKILDSGDKWAPDLLILVRGINSQLQDIEFHFLLAFFAAIFPLSESLSQALTNQLDIDRCQEMLIEFTNELQDFGASKFTDLWALVKSNTESFIRPFKRRKLSETKAKENLYRGLFEEIINLLRSRIQDRFVDLDNIRFVCLSDLSRKHVLAQNFPDVAFHSLMDEYRNYFHFEKLKSELKVMYNSPTFRSCNVYDSFLKIKASKGYLPELLKFFKLILTLPLTHLSNDRPSTFEKIQHFISHRQVQEPFSDLSMLCLERKLLDKLTKDELFYDEVIKKISRRNP